MRVSVQREVVRMSGVVRRVDAESIRAGEIPRRLLDEVLRDARRGVLHAVDDVPGAARRRRRGGRRAPGVGCAPSRRERGRAHGEDAPSAHLAIFLRPFVVPSFVRQDLTREDSWRAGLDERAPSSVGTAPSPLADAAGGCPLSAEALPRLQSSRARWPSPRAVLCSPPVFSTCSCSFSSGCRA